MKSVPVHGRRLLRCNKDLLTVWSLFLEEYHPGRSSHILCHTAYLSCLFRLLIHASGLMHIHIRQFSISAAFLIRTSEEIFTALLQEMARLGFTMGKRYSVSVVVCESNSAVLCRAMSANGGLFGSLLLPVPWASYK